ncbi:MAG: hypothetical protein MHM6MM_009012 [Cercozoa sp. M6MM]
MANAFSAVLGDDTFSQQRQQRLQRSSSRKLNVFTGLAHGAGHLGHSVVDAVTGVVRQPVLGAQESGASGFFKGVAHGVAGVFTKPVVGIADALASASRGIRGQDMVHAGAGLYAHGRVRLPRLLRRTQRRLVSYTRYLSLPLLCPGIHVCVCRLCCASVDAVVSFVLRTLQQEGRLRGVLEQEPLVLFHFASIDEPDKLFIALHECLLAVRLPSERSDLRVRWACAWTHLSVSEEVSNTALSLHRRVEQYRDADLSDDTPGITSTVTEEIALSDDAVVALVARRLLAAMQSGHLAA